MIAPVSTLLNDKYIAVLFRGRLARLIKNRIERMKAEIGKDLYCRLIIKEFHNCQTDRLKHHFSIIMWWWW